MTNRLKEILDHKALEVIEAKKVRPVSMLEQLPTYNRETYSLLSRFEQDTGGLIAEFKRKSPSAGEIGQSDIAYVAQGYQAAGVIGMSVLTDTKYFGGHLDDLVTVRGLVNIPLLRKDFIIDEYQLHEAKAYGADVVLLICEALDKITLEMLITQAQELELEVLLELHDASQIEKIPLDDITPDLIGVNNRNLVDFSVDINRSIALFLQLRDVVPSEIPLISESGFLDTESAIKVLKAGYNGWLIGSAFMSQEDPVAACTQFLQQVNTVQKEQAQ